MSPSSEKKRGPGRPRSRPESQIRCLKDEAPAPIRAMVESERERNRVPVTGLLTRDNKSFVEQLAKVHNQSVAFVVDRLVEAAKLGVPYRIPTKLSAEIMSALEFINKRRSMETRAKMMMSKMRDKHGRNKKLPKENSLGD